LGYSNRKDISVSKKIAVTGGGGFIGSYVIDELIERGYTPVVFDRHSHELPLEAEFFLGDVRDATAMTELAAHVDGIIHLAACLGTQETIKNPRPAAETNIVGGLNFLEACNQYDLPGVYIGVGNHWFNNTYSITKTTIERFVHMFNKERGGRINIVRAVNAYGPRQSVAAPFGSSKVRKITPAFICRALSEMPIEVYGDGSQVSDMVYVGDVAKALVLALGQAMLGNVLEQVVEVGSPVHTTVEDVANLISRYAHDLGYPQLPTKHLPMRPGEKEGERVTANIETLSWIGFDPNDLVPLDEGMKQTVSFYENRRGALWNPPEK
jgi:nucleoside-diphosphate-sugar epimerase